MLAFNHTLLNKEWALINVLKALVSLVSMSNVSVIFLSKITPKYFTWFTSGMFRSFCVYKRSTWPEPYPYWLCSSTHIMTPLKWGCAVASWERNPLYGLYKIYKLYKAGERMDPCGTLACISLCVDISPSTKPPTFLLKRKEIISFIKLVENCNFDNLYNKPDCQVVSKAFSVPKNTTAVDILLKFVTWSVSFIHWNAML